MAAARCLSTYSGIVCDWKYYCVPVAVPVQEAEALQRKRQARAAAAEECDDSALSAFDPYGRHKSVYKGIRLHEDTDRKELVSLPVLLLLPLLLVC